MTFQKYVGKQTRTTIEAIRLRIPADRVWASESEQVALELLAQKY